MDEETSADKHEIPWEELCHERTAREPAAEKRYSPESAAHEHGRESR